MGCDIHSLAERRNNDGDLEPIIIFEERYPGYTTEWEPFRSRNYSIFSFLAGVRNYGPQIVPFSEPRGLPDDSHSINYMYEKYRQICIDEDDDICSFEDWESDYHSHSWLTIEELVNFDYSKKASPNQTYRQFLEITDYFEELQKCVDRGAERIVFWFDN
jgi:hypothetical protein